MATKLLPHFYNHFHIECKRKAERGNWHCEIFHFNQEGKVILSTMWMYFPLHDQCKCPTLDYQSREIKSAISSFILYL